ncbi:OPT/YSL family transporter [Burkholderia multivorans]|uniref:OPT family oligopeptide transporter n=1 Tax=Burkholderia multivorans TaxID=87883 RepID=A0AB37ALW9_9BURK|nr:OPT/YSL family transporter [Burkholderia multivorans]MBU9589645.1 OPT/YSL family transporter [Burkholderia multivorans]PRE39282.1 hypothetical protein C6P97_30795 [Burkholderia multivorans]PRE42296.1 hypothetical protein C6P99_24810 [Burkholderia multivorans]
MSVVEAANRDVAPVDAHPRATSPQVLAVLVSVSILGAIVGIQILTTLGVTPNTSLIGALIAMVLARLPLSALKPFKSVHVQNFAQTSISSATFGAANSLILPIGIPYIMGLPALVMPMFVGVCAAMLLDAYLLYRLFNSPVFPATEGWPMGVAAAESIKAGDKGGKHALLLVVGVACGALGALLKLPMSAFGIAFLGSIAAMSAFCLGLLARGYSQLLCGIDLASYYIPHGAMIGAGIVALLQVARAVIKNGSRKSAPTSNNDAVADTQVNWRATLEFGGIAYLGLMACLAAATGLWNHMSPWMLLEFVLYGAAAAYVHELIVGIAAMHSGWFPAFAVALITLLFGILLGFPPEALVVLAGFSAATGPAFADMGYDLKAGYLLRDAGADTGFELAGRRQQLIAAMVGFLVAIVVVAISYKTLFAEGNFAPINRAYAAAIHAGVSAHTAHLIFLWAVPGAILQAIGGSRKQLGVMFATGLLIVSPAAGWMLMLGLALRFALTRWKGSAVTSHLDILAGGVIAGDALASFAQGMLSSFRSKK